MKIIEYAHPDREKSRKDLLITTVRVDEGPAHELVHIWCRGQKVGSLVLDHGDGELLAMRLIPGVVGQVKSWGEET